MGQRKTSKDPAAMMDIAEVAVALRISMKTAYRRVSDGTIPAIKIGGLWRCTRSSIEDLCGPAPEPGKKPVQAVR